MTYWAKRVIAEEAKANRLAKTAVANYRKYLQQAQKMLEKEIAVLQAAVLSGTEVPTRTMLWRYGKYVELQNTIEQEALKIGQLQVGLLDDALAKIYTDTLGVSLGELGGGTMNFQLLTPNTVEQAIKQVWAGSNYSTRVWKNTNHLATRIKQLTNELLVLGKNPEALKAALTKEFGVNYRMADRLIRTEASHTYNTAAMDRYKKAGVTQVKVLVGKDERLCDQCGGLSGIYNIGEEPILPAHANCRCSYSPVI